MDAYRIGYIVEPWKNLTPPIRGGVYKKTATVVDEDASSSTDTDLESDSDGISVGSSATSLESSVSCIAAGDVSKVESSPVPHGNAQGLRRRHDKDTTQALMVSKLSPDAYITSAIRSEIEDGIRDYPSLDQETQREINQKYQKLHERVKDEGFYQCRYLEYAKELTRYSLIFATSMFALRHGWYITSAALLGLFWVSHNPYQCHDRH